MDLHPVIWIFTLPLAAFAVNALAGHWMRGRTAGWIAVGAMGVATLITWTEGWRYFQHGEQAASQHRFFTWLQLSEHIRVETGATVNALTLMMMTVVTTVSLLVFIYSVDYMKGEKGYARFFAFLSLFSFSMLGLVAAPNLIQLYMCWELVGVSSYLLIGFYYQKPEAVAAAKKAFIVTRFADFGFLIGILLLAGLTGTIQVDELNSLSITKTHLMEQAAFIGLSSITWAMALIFMGGAGKSAMFPLHIWLPDAMEGPTPVSALIHAATMVVAGVFLVARLYPLYIAFAPQILDLIAFTGAFSLLFAAVIACTQTDIKRILAYSTMSQIGYMMLALGAGGYSPALFHLFTHAFFKALLFLGAGAIIHAVHTQDIFQMGGLRRALPLTHVLFLTGCLAIAGVPPFAGFFSKDEILSTVYHYSSLHFAVALTGAAITAFYMFRLYFAIFWYRQKDLHTHSAPLLMTIPMFILALASAAAGFIPFDHYMQGTFVGEATSHIEFVPWISVGAALVGIVCSGVLYLKKSDRRLQPKTFYKLLYNKFYMDELYIFITKKIIFQRLALPVAWFDRHVVDEFMNTLAWLTKRVAEKIKPVQSGQVQQYAWVFIAGAVALVFMLMLITR